MNYQYVVWDWNGTLLNDVEVCIESMNELLAEYSLPPIPDTARYRELFCFPVRTYYGRLGFDFEKTPFEIPAIQFIDKYNVKQQSAELFDGAAGVLKMLSDSGIQQAVLSASEKNSLLRQIRRFDIERYFTDILGIDDHYAASKSELAAGWFAENGIDRQRTVFVGDTVHDFEVAQSVGCDCILIANGHQSGEILRTVSDNIAEDISQAAEIILG